MEIVDQLNDWNKILELLPGPHILQTREWGEIKQAYGWELQPFVWRDTSGKPTAAALVMLRRITIGGFAPQLRLMYVPRGPILNWADQELCKRVLTDLEYLARQHRAVFLKIDPEAVTGVGIPGSEGDVSNRTGKELVNLLKKRHWRSSDEQTQFPNTVWIDLVESEEKILANMKQKTRYNIRLAERKGVTIRVGRREDLPMLYQMYAQTAERDGFIIRTEAYYLQLWTNFIEAEMAIPLIAEVESEPVAGLVLFIFARKAWYLHGMSTQKDRNKMPNYLLQWEAIRLAGARGCKIYDLWGAPTQFNESDSMWGVFRFKEGLGGQVVRTIGAWDYTPKPFVYFLYNTIVPRILDVMRWRGRALLRRHAER